MTISTQILQPDNQSGVEDACITLNNSFDLLSSVEVIPHGEDTLADETFNATSEGQLAASQSGTLEVPLETVCLATDTTFKGSGTLDTGCHSEQGGGGAHTSFSFY